jgi:hypothetical protein
METLDIITTYVEFFWGLFSFWTIYRILKLCWPVLKVDWFYFPCKSGYYKGLGLGLLWALLYSVPCAWLGEKWQLVPMLAQFAFVLHFKREKLVQPLEKAVWLSLPFFMFPLWRAVRQGQQEGEIPQLPNPSLNSDPTCTA